MIERSGPGAWRSSSLMQESGCVRGWVQACVSGRDGSSPPNNSPHGLRGAKAPLELQAGEPAGVALNVS